MALSEYDIKAIKGSALAEQLSYHPLNEYHPLSHEFLDDHIIMAEKDEQEAELDEWKLWFDGASNLLGNGIGVVLASPKGQYIPFSARLGFDCTNNMAEYEAYAMGITMAIEHQISKLKVFADLVLVIYQLRREWETRDAKLVPYHAYIMALSEHFDEISFHYVPRDENQMVDALATLLAMLQANQNKEMTIHVRQQTRIAHCQQVEEAEIDGKPWYHDIRKYLEEGAYSLGVTENDKRTLRRLATSFFLSGVILYKRSADSTLLRCVDDREAREIMEEVHGRAFSTHVNGHALACKILRAGYYWSKMESDCCQHVKRCMKCQMYANNIHMAPSALHNLTSPWPFSMSGLDTIGSIEPKASNGHRFILVAIDYFTKWVEAASYANVTKMMTELCEQFSITHHNSTPYRPKMNGAVEAANKNIKKIIQKMVMTYKDWHDMLPYTLHGYRISVRTSTRATPYSLVYGIEAVLPVEVEIPSLKVLVEEELDESK
ncbi:Pro-Pol polyprotein, partial [Mucuna pruriens]